MPYPRSIVTWLLSEVRTCHCCGRQFTAEEYREVHSSTSYHLVLEEAVDDPRYIYRITDPPDEFSYMTGRILEMENEFHLGKRYAADAYVVHRFCHEKIKVLALALSRKRNKDFRGGTPTPRSLHEVTQNYNQYCRVFKKEILEYEINRAMRFPAY